MFPLYKNILNEFQRKRLTELFLFKTGTLLLGYPVIPVATTEK